MTDPDQRFVPTADIRAAVKGRETDLLDALDVRWRDGKPHIRCPYRDHADNHPSWRWDERRRKAFCTCGVHDVIGVLMGVEGIEFEAAKIRVAELLNRHDLIINPADTAGLTLEQFACLKKLPIDLLQQQQLRNGRYKQVPAIRIPYFNERGELQTIQFRTGDGRQYFKKGTKVCLYGAHRAAHLKEIRYAVIDEGVSDTDTLAPWFSGVWLARRCKLE